MNGPHQFFTGHEVFLRPCFSLPFLLIYLSLSLSVSLGVSLSLSPTSLLSVSFISQAVIFIHFFLFPSLSLALPFSLKLLLLSLPLYLSLTHRESIFASLCAPSCLTHSPSLLFSLSPSLPHFFITHSPSLPLSHPFLPSLNHLLAFFASQSPLSPPSLSSYISLFLGPLPSFFFFFSLHFPPILSLSSPGRMTH